jgi:hypothetical protein
LIFIVKGGAMAKHDENEKQDPKQEALSRRLALKRIASIAAGVVAGSNIVKQALNAASYSSSGYSSSGYSSSSYSSNKYSSTKYSSSSYSSSRYVSIQGSYVNTVYADNKYVNRGPSYRDHVSYYTSYNSHGTPPPPPK